MAGDNYNDRPRPARSNEGRAMTARRDDLAKLSLPAGVAADGRLLEMEFEWHDGELLVAIIEKTPGSSTQTVTPAGISPGAAQVLSHWIGKTAP